MLEVESEYPVSQKPIEFAKVPSSGLVLALFWVPFGVLRSAL
jgi:hypothetical protein